MRLGLDADINNLKKILNSFYFEDFCQNLDEKVPKAHWLACGMSRLFNLYRNGVNKKRCNLTKVSCQRVVSLKGVVLSDS